MWRIGTENLRTAALEVRYLNQTVELDHEPTYTMTHWHTLAIYRNATGYDARRFRRGEIERRRQRQVTPLSGFGCL